MKKFIFIIALVLLSTIALGQQPTKSAVKSQPQVVKVDNKTFKSSKISKSKSDYTPTGYYFETSKGEKYEIYLHTPTRGDNAGVTQCYIQRTSKKTGKTYWQKIPVAPDELKG